MLAPAGLRTSGDRCPIGQKEESEANALLAVIIKEASAILSKNDNSRITSCSGGTSRIDIHLVPNVVKGKIQYHAYSTLWDGSMWSRASLGWDLGWFFYYALRGQNENRYYAEKKDVCVKSMEKKVEALAKKIHLISVTVEYHPENRQIRAVTLSFSDDKDEKSKKLKERIEALVKAKPIEIPAIIKSP